MKTLAILVVVISVIAVSKAGMTEEQMKMMQKVIMDCAEKEGASQDDINDFLAHKPAEKPKAKCHRACMHEAWGTLKDNKFNSDGFMAMMKMKVDGNADLMKSAQLVADDCKDIMDADRCEAGAKVCKCLYQSSVARGLA